MNLFLACTSLLRSYGGPAYSVSRLAAALGDLGLTVGLWSADGSASTAALVGDHANVIRLDGSLSAALGAFGTPDVVHDNGLWLSHNHRLAVLADRMKLPRVVSTRGMLEPWAMRHKRAKKSFAWHAYQRRDLFRASRIHATSHTEAENVRVRIPGVGVDVIPNGVDLPSDKAPSRVETSSGDRTMLFVGRLYPVKGLPMLIEAWSRVRPTGWKLSIAGPDEAGHLAEVRRAVREARLDDYVTIHGPVEGDAKHALFNSADVVVAPSYSESFGMTIAEGLSHGLPVLTTTAVPWPELTELSCGWRVSPTVEGLSEGLRVATLTEGVELRAMGLRGRELVRSRFHWGSVAREFTTLYGNVVGRG